MLLHIQTICLLIFGLAFVSHVQQPKPVDYYAGIKDVDLSRIWHAVNDKNVNDSTASLPPEPLGFIGDHYQRFYIHYTAVVKNASSPYQYIVYGKTKVKDHVCHFSGTITIVKAGLYREQADKRYKQGYVECLVAFSEDSMQRSSGSFRGKIILKFYLDKKGHAEYDDLLLGADGYSNNQCEAVWTSYETKAHKTVNWGDFRIPAAKSLDMGDGEFAVNKAYVTYGWQSYAAAWSGDPETQSAKNAQRQELAHWWE